MEADFWHQRWQQASTPFHQGRTNAMLARYFERLSLPRGATVFVPLCGKAVDMHWLHEQGMQVLGVELSPIAVEDFFHESGLAFSKSQSGEFTQLRGAGVTLLCGDFFKLDAELLSGVSAVYDRAALVALPPAMRGDYVAKLFELLAAGTAVLLLTLEYPAHEIEGPPFSVTPAEVQDYFRRAAGLTLLDSKNIIAEEPGLQRRGLTDLVEHAFLIEM